MNTIQHEKRQRAQEARDEIARLKQEVKARDREIYELQNATIVMDTERVWDLEQQVERLEEELARKTAAMSAAQSEQSRGGQSWTTAVSRPDPFAADDFINLLADEDEFGDETVAQLACSTPSRARSSFPTPPATSPPMPGTPCLRASRSTPVSHMGVQVSFPDPREEGLEAEMVSLNREVSKLTDTLDSYKLLSDRLLKRISEQAPELSKRSSDDALEDLETLVQRLLRSMSDRTCALDHLKSSIGALGFAGDDASEMVTSLASGFRAARLELEYLTPGEITLPLTSRGAEVLDLMLTRLRAMAKRAKEDEDSIDEYHQIELSLRKQLDARVSVMDGLKAEMSKAESILGEKTARIRDLEVANERLRGAVDGYVRDVSELEKLIQQMESDYRDAKATHHAQLESNRRVLCKKEDAVAELETKLEAALQRAADAQRQVAELREARDEEVAGMRQRHGHDLAVRDARAVELRAEIDGANEALRTAHETVLALRVENGGLQTEADGEQSSAKAVVGTIRGELQRLLQMSSDYLNAPRKRPRGDDDQEEAEEEHQAEKGEAEASTPPGSPPSEAARREYFAGGLARGRSLKRRRGYDSGMGLLEEDQSGMEMI